MSLIGPRPIICTSTEWIEERDKYGANSIKPGITGLAQISGRDTLSHSEKAILDGEYAEKFSFSMGWKIFFETIKVVLSKKDVLEDKHG